MSEDNKFHKVMRSFNSMHVTDITARDLYEVFCDLKRVISAYDIDGDVDAAIVNLTGVLGIDNGSSEFVKYDADKPCPASLMKSFSHAIMLVSEAHAYGAKKYGMDNWVGISVERYENAMMRHYLALASGDTVDAESGIRHDVHMLWNAMAIVELSHRASKLR